MNQPQRMAPVGTDKELSDLLDFSMVSWARLLPLPAPPRFLGRKHQSERLQQPGLPSVETGGPRRGWENWGALRRARRLCVASGLSASKGTCRLPRRLLRHRMGSAHHFTDGETEAQRTVARWTVGTASL